MIVTSVQIKTVKTQKHLYCPVFTNSQPDPGYSGTRLIHIYVTGGRAS